jgi:hypothetical protein
LMEMVEVAFEVALDGSEMATDFKDTVPVLVLDAAGRFVVAVFSPVLLAVTNAEYCSLAL